MSDRDLTHRQETARRAFSVITAEGVGTAVSLGSLMLAKGVAGKQMDKVKDWAAKSLILPVLGQVENIQEKLGRNKPEKEEWKAQMTPEQRARKYAESLVDFSIMLPAGLAVRLGVQSVMDEKLGVPIEDKRSYVFAKVVDTSVGVTSMVALNTVAKLPAEGASITLSTMFSKMGMPKETADSMGKYMVYLQLPNAAGMVANIAALNHLAKQVDEHATKPGRSH